VLPRDNTAVQVQSWLNSVLWGRAIAVLRQGRSLVEVERQQQELKERRWKGRFKLWQDIMLLLNFYTMLLLLMGLSFGVGTVAGVNLPEGVICHSRHSFCWHLRLRNVKQILK
jgi:hypothetical protein